MTIDVFTKFLLPGLMGLGGLGFLINAINDKIKSKKSEKKEQAQKEKNRHDKIVKYKAIEKITKQETHLEQKIIKDQLRIVKELSDLMYSAITETYCNALGCSEGDKLTLATENNLVKFRKKTDALMLETIYHNGIAEKNDDQWKIYIKRKIEWIFKEMVSFGKDIYKEDHFNMTYEEHTIKVMSSTLQIYRDYIFDMFNDIRTIAVKIKTELIDLKETKKKVMKDD